MKRWVWALALCAAGCGVETGAPDEYGAGDDALVAMDTAPNGRGGGLARETSVEHATKPQSSGGGTGIQYHGGPVMLGTTNLYYVWYGNWSGNSATTILTDLANGIGGTPYYGINTSYSDGAGHAVSNAVHFGGDTTDAYSQGKSLSDAAVQRVVSSAITSGRLPLDPSGVYFVLTSADVAQTGFCSSYCGWHTHATVGSTDVKYGFIGDASRCPKSCAEETTKSPNGNVGADAMASIIAHELDESVTDPDLNAWFDKRGQENADKCAWTFGTTFPSSNGAAANVHFGGRDWLIQQNWVNQGSGGCAMSLPGVASAP